MAKGLITTGRFRFNNKDKEVNKAYKGNIASRSLYMGKDHIWPSYEIFCIDKTTSFVANKNSNWKDKQTGLSTYNFSGYSYSSIAVGIDPSGGNVATSIINRETSYWHCLSLEISAYTRCNGGTGVVFDDNAITYDTNIKVSDGKPYISSITKTEEASNVAIVQNDEYKWNVKRWAVKFNQTDDLPLDFSTKGALLQINIPSNDNPFTSVGLLRITKFFNEFGELKDIPVDIHEGILTWKQNPNSVYRVQMCWVTGDGTNTPLKKEQIQSMGYTTTTKSYWLCIEFGISKTGGSEDSDFLWNQDLEADGIVIPNNISSMVKVTTTGVDSDKFTVTVANSIREVNKNYVEIIVRPKSNNDYSHNINRTPIYKSEVYKEYSTEIAAQYNHDKIASTLVWNVKRYTSTQPWDATIQIEFTGVGVLSNFKGTMS